jgi:hypothetical protein
VLGYSPASFSGDCRVPSSCPEHLDVPVSLRSMGKNSEKLLLCRPQVCPCRLCNLVDNSEKDLLARKTGVEAEGAWTAILAPIGFATVHL